jgi:hypothetical protein
MRTTLTLVDGVTAQLERVRRARHARFNEVVNEAFREGLQDVSGPRQPLRAFQTRPVDLGHCLIGFVDDVTEALAVAEGEDQR